MIYKEINDKYQCIFIHIPKTGGISIKNLLSPDKKSGIAHKRIIEYYNENQEKYAKYYKFTIVRNPWDRFVSAYFYLRQGGRNQTDLKWAEQYLIQYKNFQEFVYALEESEEFRKQVLSFTHFIPQYHFITIDGKISVDYIGRLETMDESFAEISKQLNISNKLSHDNKSNHKKYQQYYNQKSQNIIQNIYKKDIELFDYVF